MQIKTPVGEFPMPEELTFRELQEIKTFAGVMPAEIPDALEGGDPNVLVAFVMIAAKRCGKRIAEGTVLDWSMNSIEFVEDEADKPKARRKKAADPT
jgi:hypothetical protein